MGKGKSSTTASDRTVFGTKTFEELQAYADSIGVTVDDSLSNFQLEGLQMAVKGVQRVLAEFPNIPREFLKLTDGGDRRAYASSNFNGEIKLSRRYWYDWDALREFKRKFKNDVDLGWHPLGTSDADVIPHEVGHMIERALIEAKNPGTDFYDMSYKTSLWENCTYADQIITEACKVVGGGGYYSEYLIVNDVSEYATRNRSETLAECVSDYFCNGSDANPLSVAVVDILKRRL